MLSELDKSIIRKLQEDLPIVPNPFKVIADEVGLSEKEVVNKVQEYHERGLIRRLGAVLHHRNAGFSANAMVVWIIPEDRIDETGKSMASFPCVSHCYQRPAFPGWPYNLFTMVHARTFEECEGAIGEIAEAVDMKDYKVLYSSKELKKSSMKYFLENENSF